MILCWTAIGRIAVVMDGKLQRERGTREGEEKGGDVGHTIFYIECN
jgi:hypothetical protein